MDHTVTLNRQRGAVKAKITKLEQVCDAYCVSDRSFVELNLHLKTCSDLKLKTEEIRNQYYELPADLDLKDYEDELEQLSDRLHTLEVSFHLLLSNLKNESESTEITPVQHENKTKVNIKLPEIPLPLFNGLYSEWSTFKEQFNNLISQNEKLTDSQKLYYLRSALKGPAKQIECSHDTFEALFQALTIRYENVRAISDMHIQAILNLGKIQKESARDLRCFVDNTRKNLRSLKSLKFVSNDFSDAILVNILLSKLDKESRKLFESTLHSTEVPKLDQFLEFLEKRSLVLESIDRNFISTKPEKSDKSTPDVYKTKSLLVDKNEKLKTCELCKSNSHFSLNKCPKFLKMSVMQRYDFVKERKLCIGCLKGNHLISSCWSKNVCMFCKKNSHNSLLHRNMDESSTTPLPLSSSQTPTEATVEQMSTQDQTKKEQLGTFQNLTLNNVSKKEQQQKKNAVLLSTVMVYVRDVHGKRKRIRALLDNASNICCLSNECASILGIRKTAINVPVTGLNGSVNTIKSKIEAVVTNADETFEERMEFFIVPKITDLTPATYLDTSEVFLPDYIELADPTYYRPGAIQALISAEFFFKILKSNVMKVSEKMYMQETVFGWIATGMLKETKPSSVLSCHLIKNCDSLDNELKRFWELEAIGIRHDDFKNSDEDQAMKIFNQTTTFKNGRYEVELPWKNDWAELGNNFDVARSRLHSLQRKLSRNENLYSQYVETINDYLNKGIIEKVENENSCDEQLAKKPVYYLPHQAVYREDKLTSKLRIVFDASSHDSGQISLNECLWPGPNLNPNIFDILINFRLCKVALLSDIEKAFLQISLSEKHRDAVRFLWYEEVEGGKKHLQTFRFKRVLFGVNASPFLLRATIKKHIEQFRDQYPSTTQLLDHCLYVDDFITNVDSSEEALKIAHEAQTMMMKAGMFLRKWVSNDASLMEQLKQEKFDTLPQYEAVSLGSNLTKVLGLAWNTLNDCFTVEVESLIKFISTKVETKRSLLQTVAKIYDPLGLLTPFTIRAKCLFQELWQRKIEWDDILPPDINEEWMKWCQEVPQLSKLKIPRVVLNSTVEESNDIVEVHVFSDASKKAYGVAIYLRVVKDNTIEVNLITSKSRVAPLKKITLPRLELLGALLAARLTSKIKPMITAKKPVKFFYWTDSKIVLYWIRGSVKRWKNFIANRVCEIANLSDKNSWRHCPGKLNVADILTRGMSAENLVDSSIWWKGPIFLTSAGLPIENENLCVSDEELLPELKKNSNIDSNMNINLTLFLFSVPDFFERLLNASNKLTYIVRVLAVIYRFLHNARSPLSLRRTGALTSEEMNFAEISLVKWSQQQEFEADIKSLKREGTVSTSSRLRNLDPFLDDNGILRVGGRLENSPINHDRKHPILLSPKSKLTKIIILSYHKKYLHSGPQMTLFQIRQKYWPLNGRNLCRQIIHSCIKCFKINPKVSNQKMGNLPKQRITPDFVFNSVGVDLCGPFYIKNKNQRKGNPIKIYVCIFVCLVTKAIHLEMISDLTSECFLATLKRFISRRGKCRNLLSDNAPNFTKSCKELKILYKQLSNQDEILARFFAEENIEWKFIPPRAPNFGGLWEAGVKSFKFYFKRIMGSFIPTYEEFITVMNQIESLLNSRPLTPLTSDIDDLQILTPAHFLIGRSFSTIPEPMLLDVKTNSLSRWQMVTRVVQTIWKNWKNNYLSSLHERNKWMFAKQNIKIGEMVLIMEDNLPVGKWLLGRIVKTYPGKDNVIRVVDVKTKFGIKKRAVSKLCILPIES